MTDAIQRADDLLGRCGHSCEGCRRPQSRTRLAPSPVDGVLLCETCHKVEVRIEALFAESLAEYRNEAA